MSAAPSRLTFRDQFTVFGLGLLFFGASPFLCFMAVMFLGMLVPDFQDQSLKLMEYVFESSNLTMPVLMVSVSLVSLGTLITLFSLFVWKIRNPWFYRWMQAASVVYFFCGPGIILAIVVSRYLHHNKAEFYRVPVAEPPTIPQQRARRSAPAERRNGVCTMTSPVTTKRGDSGTTMTLAGQRLAKSHPILQTTGRVDSLRAQTALLRTQILERGNDAQQELAEPLFWLLHCYFLIGTAVNDPECVHPEYRQTDLGDEHLTQLEAIQTDLEAKVSLPKSFIVSASNTLAAQADVTATVARELERTLVSLKEAVPAFEERVALAFINRLSDFLYIVARVLEEGEHVPVDYGVLDT